MSFDLFDLIPLNFRYLRKTKTTAINNLLKKGYVNRKRGEKDRRVVYISLSEKGRKAYSHHREFHKRMIQGLLDTLNEQEQDLLVKVMLSSPSQKEIYKQLCDLSLRVCDLHILSSRG